VYTARRPQSTISARRAGARRKPRRPAAPTPRGGWSRSRAQGQASGAGQGGAAGAPVDCQGPGASVAQSIGVVFAAANTTPIRS